MTSRKQKRPLVYLTRHVNLHIGHASYRTYFTVISAGVFSAFAVGLKSDDSHLCSWVTARYSVHEHATHHWSQKICRMVKPSQLLKLYQCTSLCLLMTVYSNQTAETSKIYLFTLSALTTLLTAIFRKNLYMLQKVTVKRGINAQREELHINEESNFYNV